MYLIVALRATWTKINVARMCGIVGCTTCWTRRACALQFLMCMFYENVTRDLLAARINATGQHTLVEFITCEVIGINSFPYLINCQTALPAFNLFFFGFLVICVVVDVSRRRGDILGNASIFYTACCLVRLRFKTLRTRKLLGRRVDLFPTGN